MFISREVTGKLLLISGVLDLREIFGRTLKS